MRSLHTLKHAIKSRLGELWWYTIVMFFAQQLGAVINAFIGLFLVPKYVPQAELGAVLPLASIGSMMGLPLTILMMPFLKFLSKYMTQGEMGKVKALLRDVFILTWITFVLIAGLAYFFMPFVFERMRVQNGSLSILIICSGIIGALAPVFNTALQALKRFKMMSALGFAGAIVRLVTLLIALPIRGLSGYFIGQIVPVCFGIMATMVALRKQLGKSVKATSYWDTDWKLILTFTAWNAVLYSVSQVMGTTEGFVIRHRLSDLESAGYYMISRFAEISFLISSACTVVLFPLISEHHEKGNTQQEQRLLMQSILVSFGTGLLSAVGITAGVYGLFLFKADWTMYLPFIPHMFALALLHVIRGSTHSFILYKTAKNEFNFVPYYVGILGTEAVLLYCLTGYSFFAPWLPATWLEQLAAFNPCRLSVVLGVMLAHGVAILLYVIAAIVRIQSRNPACPASARQHPS